MFLLLLFRYFADKYTEDRKDSSSREKDENVEKVKPAFHTSPSLISTLSAEDVNPAYRYIETVEEREK